MSSGRYHFGGWSVSGGEGAGRLASVHEAWHDRLQFTTIYGLVVQHLWAVGEATGQRSWTTRGDNLLLGARRTHEEYAALMTEVLAGDLLPRLRDDYPDYAVYSDAARKRSGPPTDDYALLQRVSAVYRASMQPAGLYDLGSDLDTLLPSRVDRRKRPDHRLQLLTSALARAGWPTSSVEPGSAGGAPASERKTVRDFADEPDESWEYVNAVYYDWCRDLLNDAGCATLGYNQQLDITHGLNDAAVTAAGGPIRLVPSSVRINDKEEQAAEREGDRDGDRESRQEDDLAADADVVIGAFESETLAFEPRPPVSVLDSGVPVNRLVSGRDVGRHVFIAIRPAHRLNWEQADTRSPSAAADHTIVARSSRQTAEGTVVYIRPVTLDDVRDLVSTGTPVIVSVSMLSLGDTRIRESLEGVLTADRCTVLMDLSPARHVRMWAAEPETAITYGFGEYRVGDRHAVALGVAADTLTGTSRLYLAVVSPAYATAFAVWVNDTPTLRHSVTRDDTVLDRHSDLLSATMGHLLAEEPFFDFKAGHRHG